MDDAKFNVFIGDNLMCDDETGVAVLHGISRKELDVLINIVDREEYLTELLIRNQKYNCK